MKRYLSLTTRRNIKGYIFVAPLMIGLILFFIQPIVQSFQYMFSKVSVDQTGVVVESVGLENLKDLFIREIKYTDALIKDLGKMLLNLPLVLVFSTFAALLLHQQFTGRGFARAIFFLPVIITSGILLNFDGKTAVLINKGMTGDITRSAALTTGFLKEILYNIQFDQIMIQYILVAVDSIYSIINYSGMQILIYLAALHQVSPELREAARIDGATSWESYWKITLPITSPFLLVNTIYTIVDSFTREVIKEWPTTNLLGWIDTLTFYNFNIGNASALAWVYFLIILVILGIIVKLASKVVFYDY